MDRPQVPKDRAPEDVGLQDAKTWLDAWRAAEHRRDSFAYGTPEWEEADADVRSARQSFDAAFAQSYARYAEEQYQAQNPHRSTATERRTSPTE